MSLLQWTLVPHLCLLPVLHFPALLLPLCHLTSKTPIKTFVSALFAMEHTAKMGRSGWNVHVAAECTKNVWRTLSLVVMVKSCFVHSVYTDFPTIVFFIFFIDVVKRTLQCNGVHDLF